MSDEKLSLVAEVKDQFTGPLDKLATALKRTGESGVQTGKDLKKDFDGFHGSLSKATGTLQGMLSPLQSLGVVSLGAGLGLSGIATALRGFSTGTQQLSMLAKETHLSVDQLRAFNALGARFGVSSEAIGAGALTAYEGVRKLKMGFGELQTGLVAIGRGDVANKLFNVKDMKEAMDVMMQELEKETDSYKRGQLSEILLGSKDFGRIAAELKGKYSDTIRELMETQGKLSASTEKAAAEFEKNMSRMGTAAERLKISTLGPLLEIMNKIVESGDKAGIRGNAEAMNSDLDGRLADATKRRATLDPVKDADAIKSLDKEIRNLSEAIKRSKDGAGPAGVSAIPMSYSGGAGGGNGAPRIYNASFGGGASGGAGGGSFGAAGMGGPLPTLGGGYGAAAAGNPNFTGGAGRGYGGGASSAATPSVAISPNTPIDPFRASTGGRVRRRDNFDEKASQITPRLMKEFDLSREQASGIVGNLGHESGGFRFHQELNPRGGGRGGIGWAQWTGPRRRAFEKWTAERGLDPKSDEASYGFLTQGDPEFGKAVRAVKKTSTPEDASVAFEGSFERAGVKAYSSRFGFARRAMRLPDAETQTALTSQVPGVERSGDKMMRRFYGDEAPTMKPGGKGSLDITLHGFPAGAKPRASMDDLFKEVNVSKSRQMETTSI